MHGVFLHGHDIVKKCMCELIGGIAHSSIRGHWLGWSYVEEEATIEGVSVVIKSSFPN